MANPTNLYEYYKAQGKPLPSVAERTPLAAQHGIANYTGTAEQNTALLSKMQAGTAPGALPPGSLPPANQGAVPPGTGQAAVTTTGLGDMGNLRLALKAALTEAAQTKQDSRITAMSGLLEGGASPNVINAALGLARSGLQQKSEDIFNTVMESRTEEIKLQEAKKTSAMNMINTAIDNGVFADTPAGMLLAWEKEAGLSEGTALAWQARLKIEQDKSEEKGDLQLKLLKKQIAEVNTPNVPAGEKRDSVVSTFFESKKGTDGYISATTYQEGLKKFIANGGTQSNFYASFPQQTYLKGQEIEKLPPAIKQQQTAPKGDLTPDQQSIINDAKSTWDIAKQNYTATPELRDRIIQQSIKQYGFDLSPYF
jgi:hypothetical protein